MAMDSPFIHLHNHSEYSILDGCMKVADLVEAAYVRKMPAVALTDHGNVFGALQFFKEAKARDIKPILGCEIYVAPKSRFDKKPIPDENGHSFHLVLLVKNDKGYRNLCRLLTAAYLEGFYYKPRIDKELLAEHAEGLIGLSSCLKGEINVWLSRGRDDTAAETARTYASFFSPGDFYIELMDHGLPEQKANNPRLISLARDLGLPLVATNDIHFLKKEDASTQDILICIQTNRKLTDPDRMRFAGNAFYFRSAEEMAELFADVPEALRNTARIAATCDFDFPAKSYFLPNFQPPEGRVLGEYFETTAREGLSARLAARAAKNPEGDNARAEEAYYDRFEKEIKLIKQFGFEGYFLIVWDLIRTARAKKIPVGPGRGSAAGSLLAYCLNITQIDPLEYDLLFERFLNPERISLPDIDIDFCARRREEIIHDITEKYGRENVSQIITFGTMAARQAIRDVGRVLELPLPEVDRIAKMIPSAGPNSTIEDALRTIPELRDLGEKNPLVSKTLENARKLEGQVRHPSIHAAGIVITPTPIVNYAPLYQSAKGEITTQFPMQDVEAIGLLKMDILGLRNLTVIDDTLALVERDTGVRPDIDAVPLDDAKTFVVFQSGNTDGVFQFESPGMKDLLRKFKPEAFRDLIALNALYRPGPLKSGLTDEFIRRKNNPERTVYEIPELEPILRETRGVMVYQEQVLRIAADLAGFSLAEADLLRKAISKKVDKIMREQRTRFIQGAKKKGISQVKAGRIFDQIRNFAEYGFNKSHSAAYAYLAYKTAYLKAHYPLHFLAALLTSEAERGATSQVVKYVAECHEMGIAILPPDINRSDYPFTVEGDAIRFGLAAVKNLGETSVRDILALRRTLGSFQSPFDLFQDAGTRSVNRKALESLIKAGAFDALGWRRAQGLAMLDTLIDYAHEIQKADDRCQTRLFDTTMSAAPDMPPEIRNMDEWDESTLLSHEHEALGFYLSRHPLARFRNRLSTLVSHNLADLDENSGANGEVRLAGIVASIKPLKTRKNDERMASFILEDMTARADVVAFPECFARYGACLHEGRLVWVRGKCSGEGERRRIAASRIMSLDEALISQAKRVVIRVFLPGMEKTVLSELKTVLEKHPGKCPVFFDLETSQALRVLTQSAEVQSVAPTDDLIRDVESLLGEKSAAIDYEP
jgi:DNA polymerase III subunit alpha